MRRLSVCFMVVFSNGMPMSDIVLVNRVRFGTFVGRAGKFGMWLVCRVISILVTLKVVTTFVLNLQFA